MTETTELPAIEFVIKLNNPEYKREADELYKSIQELIASDTSKKASELDPNLSFRVVLIERDSSAMDSVNPLRSIQF